MHIYALSFSGLRIHIDIINVYTCIPTYICIHTLSLLLIYDDMEVLRYIHTFVCTSLYNYLCGSHMYMIIVVKSNKFFIFVCVSAGNKKNITHVMHRDYWICCAETLSFSSEIQFN